jgi:hypothetical protein
MPSPAATGGALAAQVPGTPPGNGSAVQQDREGPGAAGGATHSNAHQSVRQQQGREGQGSVGGATSNSTHGSLPQQQGSSKQRASAGIHATPSTAQAGVSPGSQPHHARCQHTESRGKPRGEGNQQENAWPNAAAAPGTEQC